MIRRSVTRTVLLLALLDQFVLIASLAAALWLKTHWILPDPNLPVGRHVHLFVRLWPFLAITLALAGAYDVRAAAGRLHYLLRRALVSAAVLAGVWIAGSFYLKMSELFEYSRGVFTLFLAFTAAGLLGVRVAVARGAGWIARRAGRVRRVLVFGGEGVGRRIVRILRRQLFVPIQVIGITGDVRIRDVPRLTEEEALERIRQGEVDHIVADLPPRRMRLLLRVARAAEREGIPLQLTSTIFPGIHLRPQVDQIGRIPVIELSAAELPLSGLLIKRALDVAVSLTGLVVLAPLFAVIAALVKLTSPGPVFYVQERIGLDGRRFRMIKFRTMRVDAEKETGPIFATTDDARATRVGRYLRRYNLDELPQLLNVLRGEMSLVGPRPERPEFVEQFKPLIERYSHKHWVRPGITGWAQVNGWRGRTDLNRRIRHDIYYIERWSLWFDLKILLMTLLPPLARQR